MAGHAPADRRDEAEAAARRALADPEAAVRATALGALLRLGRLTGADVSAAAGDQAPGVRARAAELGCRLGAVALPELRRLLGDARAEVVEAACFGLGELGPDAAPAVADLGQVAGRHTDPLCREAAVAALGAVGNPAGRGAILAAMTDKPAVRRRAVLALAPFDGPEVEAALQAAVADRDWQVRQAAEDLTGHRQGG
jgi:HEAT repeat protein